MENSLETSNLRKDYPGRTAISAISFKVKSGSVHGFLGPNGAGKTTTMKILTGLINATSGDYKVNGKIGFLPENPPLYGNMTVTDYLKFVYDINADKIDENRIEEVLGQCGLKEVRDRLIQNLSKGYRQRVGIAQAIIHSPEIIILDEPTVGLDPVAISEIRDLILKLKGKHTILFSSHQLHEVELLCDEITMVNNGKVMASGSISEIQKNLKTKLHFKAEIKKISNEKIAKMKQSYAIESIETTVLENGNVELNLFCNSNFDKLKGLMDLTKFLSSDEIGLFSFHEEKLDLEEIFKRMTTLE